MDKEQIIEYLYENNVRGDLTIEQMAEDLADRKAENSSEIPNNCDGCKEGQEDCYGCPFVKRDEPQYDFGEYADRLWKIAYERGKREALEQTEPSCDTCKLKGTTEWCKRQEVCRAYQPKDEPQTCSVNGRPYTDCGKCEYFRCTADEPQTERSE